MSESLLVVDDEPLNLEIIAEYLDASDYALTLAGSGEEAWLLLDENPQGFNLVLLDRMMPGIDGMTLLRRIKGDARTRHLPVIMQTAAAAPDQVSEGLAAGAYYYLTKPFEARTLLTIVRAALSDRARWIDVTQRIANHGLALALVEQANFALADLPEAEALAGLLATLAKRPEAVAMGLVEMLLNGIEHGNLGIDFETKSRLKQEDGWMDEVRRRLALPENRGKRVKVALQRQGAEWVVLIADEGPGFDWRRFIEIAPERAFAPNGRGIALSREIAFSAVNFLGSGNTVEVRFAADDTVSERNGSLN